MSSVLLGCMCVCVCVVCIANLIGFLLRTINYKWIILMNS